MILFNLFSNHAECWIKGRYFSDDRTCFCLDGAILQHYKGDNCVSIGQKVKSVIFQNEEWRARVERLKGGGTGHYPVPRSPEAVHVPFFNDHPDTTVQDIIEVCRLAQV
jgi:hypothetical protein